MQHKHTIVALLSGLLAACGGGGSSPTQVDPKLSQAIQNGAEKANTNIPSVGQPSKPFTGAYVSIAGVSQGYATGSSPRQIAEELAALVVANPVTFSEYYRMMLSSDGLEIRLAGEKIGNSSINGIPLYAPDIVFVAKLTSGGLVITEKGKG